jgi:hypothetical protein
MDDILMIIGKLYLELYQAQKMIDMQDKKIKEMTIQSDETQKYQ